MGVEVTAQRPTVEKHYVARILERKDLSEDLWVIKVDPGGPFSFKAGQYATLGVEHEGKRIERAYSIVSSPYEEGLEFFVEPWICGAGGRITFCWRRLRESHPL